MNLSEDQENILIRNYGDSLARAILQALEEEQVFTLYGDYPEEKVSSRELDLQVQLINEIIEREIRPILGNFTTDILKTHKQAKEFENRINSLENIIEPDKTDVHNIDRRIVLLAQRIARLESDSKKWWKR